VTNDAWDEAAETRDRKIHGSIPEHLPKLIRIPREEIAERAKEIHAVEAVRYIGTQSDAIPQFRQLSKGVCPSCEIRVVCLIMILATFAVSRVGTGEGTSPAMSNLRPNG